MPDTGSPALSGSLCGGASLGGLFACLFWVFFEPESCCAIQSGLELTGILLFQLLYGWDYGLATSSSCLPLLPAYNEMTQATSPRAFPTMRTDSSATTGPKATGQRDHEYRPRKP